MDCVFVRHGIAVEPEEWDGLEENRPLTEKGRKRVQQAAAGFAAMNFTPTHLLSSPFLRAKDTARLIRTVFCPSLKVETRDELAVRSSPERVLTMLQKLPFNSVIICVGHEPLLGAVISVLLCGKLTEGFPMKKAGAALIQVSDVVKPGEGVLRWWLQPTQLRALRKGKKIDRPEEH